MKIVADNKIPFLRGVLESCCEVEYYPGAEISPEHVKDADALIVRTRTKCNADLLAGSQVKIVATATIGYDHLDTGYLDKAGIKWTNAPGCNSSSVAQYITSVLLNLAVRYDFSLRGKTLGVIGVGNVGRKVVKVGAALGMTVLLNDPPRARAEGSEDFTNLDELLAKADVVTVHVPLNKSGEDMTLYLADKGFFEKMKPEAFFINSSRGPVCDNPALKKALESKTIRGAVLDVWEDEPDFDIELHKLLEYGTPHIAGYSYDGKANGTSMSVHAISRELGLDFTDWRPDDVPLPENTSIILEDADSVERILLAAINHSYDISNDDRCLRQSPETFEKQRGDYPLRREFHLFNFSSGLNSEKIKAALHSLQELSVVTAFNYREN
jgi:erythronate-4-phosphate dehydrogenase